jgi:Gly-Xaa carboxypeptidase
MKDTEKQEEETKRYKRWLPLFTTAVLASVGLLTAHLACSPLDQDVLDTICPLGSTVRPYSFVEDPSSLDGIMKDPDYRTEAAMRLSGAVRIPSVSYDNMPEVGDDPVWDPFRRLHDYLEEHFPLVHKHLEVEKVHEIDLLYTWKGTNASLKPLLLTAHQDVVPVEDQTRHLWKFHPFSGFYDGKYVWGRGSSDDKSMMLAILEATEKLLQEGYSTERSVIIGFGYDEESAGAGAYHLARLLEERYGCNSIYALIDEGSAVTKVGDRIFALPSVAEKGATALTIALTTPGGHSSVPPPNTNIGIMAQLVEEIESNPFEPLLTEQNPTLKKLQCFAKYTDKYKGFLKRSIFKAPYSALHKWRVVKYLLGSRETEFNVRTTQAIDIINGGLKSNALPEYVSMVVDHRINIGSSTNETTAKIVTNIQTISKRHGLGLLLGDEVLLPKTVNGYFQVSWDRKLEPAPVSPTSGETWNIFAGSIKHIIEDYMDPNGAPAVVTGELMMGNTDTCQYWNLTDNIYRFSMSVPGEEDSKIHSVDEHLEFDGFLYEVGFIYEYIKNVNDFATV